MHKKMNMKKTIIIIALIALVGVVGFMLVKGRFDIRLGAKVSTPGQIMLLNDSSGKISVEYKVDNQDVDAVLPPREEIACGANGFVRVFTADKSGSYEVIYPVDQKERKVALSQIIKAAKKDSVEGGIFTEKGMVGDIKITYEEPLDLDVTY